MPITAYKAVNNKNGVYSCRGFVYEIGKEYVIDGGISICNKGFHCCKNPSDVYNYYSFGDTTEVFIVEIPDDAIILEEGDKICVSKIKLVAPVYDKSFNTGNKNTGHSNTGHSNTGHSNTGHSNTGDWNTGNWNTGDWNTGNWNTGGSNTGNWNTGDDNTGHSNTGDDNTGNSNTGHSNTGYWNTGHSNTGNWNSANNQTGFFNTVEAPISLFNGRALLMRDEAISLPGVVLMDSCPSPTKWIERKDLTDQQLSLIGEHCTGLTIVRPVKERQDWWDNLSNDDRESIKAIPGFCPVIFKEITGISVDSTI